MTVPCKCHKDVGNDQHTYCQENLHRKYEFIRIKTNYTDEYELKRITRIKISIFQVQKYCNLFNKFAQTSSDKAMIQLIRQLNEKDHLKIAVINNEAQELNDYRINKFQLNQFIDFFISCIVHIRNPMLIFFDLH